MTTDPTVAERKPIESSTSVRESRSDFGNEPTHATWRLPTVVELLNNDYPNRLADQLDELLGCCVWLSHQNQQGRIVETIASRSTKNLALSTESLESIASDASQNSAPISTRCSPKLPTSPSAIMDQVWATHPDTSSLSVSLPMEQGTGHWNVTLAWRETSDSTGVALQNSAWLELNAASLGSSLEAWSIQQNGRYYQSWQKRILQIRSRPKLWVLASIVGLAIILMIPIPYQPKRNCVLEPSSRRFVASPIEGRLKSIEVRPGEIVKQGQLLGQIDDTQIIRDLGIAEAELQTQNKKREVALATRAGGELRLAQLECQLVQLKIDSLNDQLQRLEIVSPSDGIIVQGDWHGNEGMPVSFGQTLFEVAPLDRMTAEIHLKAEDLPWIHLGSGAVLRTEATLGQSWRGSLERIEPHAEVIDEEAVFIGEMEIDNVNCTFRPGMKAQVAVEAGKKTLLWILFRKPYQWLQNQWVW